MKPTTIAIPVKRKLIDIPEDIFKTLSIKAASTGMSLKKYIEALVIKDAEDFIDSELYKWLCETRPEGREMLSPEEQEVFEKKYGLGNYR